MAKRGEAKIVKIKTFDEVETMVDCVRRRESVIVDLEGIPNDIGRRILDFLCGATFALDGTVNRLKYKQYILIPHGIKISRVKT